MKKFSLILFVAIVVALGAGWAYTNPDPPPRPERRAMERVFAFGGGGYRLGVVLSEINPHLRDDLKVDSGVLVDEVLSDSPAEKAGLKDGDIIVRMDGKSVDSERDIRETLRDLEDSKPVTVDVVRNGKAMQLTVTPEKREHTLLGNFGKNYIGVDLQEMDSDLAGYFQAQPDSGILVARVEPNTPAEKAGLKSGDVITEINGQKVRTQKDLRKGLDDVKEGESATLTVLRRGKSQKISVQPEARQFHMPNMESLGELRELKNLGELGNLEELRNLRDRPEFRESMRELRHEMEQLKQEMEELKRDFREKD
jgi:membrane-associated protease RseP (regulator of RpoE activity)